MRDEHRREGLLRLFPDSAGIEDGKLTLGHVSAAALAEEFGTPLVVYCERTLRARARSLRAAVGEGHVAFGTKAFANVAVLRLLREEGIGVDVASVGELAFARAAGLPGRRDRRAREQQGRSAFLRDAAAEGATVVLDSPDEAVLAAAAGVGRVLVRVTLGVDADTHEAIRTGHHGSKFGLPPAQARALVEDALARGLDVLGLHVHVGSQLADFDAQAETIVRLASFAASCRDSSGGRRESPTSAAASGSVTTSTTAPRKRRSWPRAPSRRHGRRSPKRGCRRPRCGWSRAAHWSAPPA